VIAADAVSVVVCLWETLAKGGNCLKKILVLILTLTSIISTSMVTKACGPGPGYPPPPPPYWGHYPGERTEALRVLNETRKYLFRAQRLTYGHWRADLRHAFDLQAEARELYRQWRHRQAMHLSFRAREIAQDVIADAELRGPPPPPPHRHRRSFIQFHLDL
jgi:hypothetical protein